MPLLTVPALYNKSPSRVELPQFYWFSSGWEGIFYAKTGCEKEDEGATLVCGRGWLPPCIPDITCVFTSNIEHLDTPSA